MNTDLLNQRIEFLQTIMISAGESVDQTAIEKFKTAISSLKEWETFRMNPVETAEQLQINIPYMLKLFVYSIKARIFSFEWNLLCPFCGGREHSHDNLNQLEKDLYHCTVCDIDVGVEADNHLEVSFTLKSEISGFLPDQYISLDAYLRYYFSANFVRPETYLTVINKQPKQRFVVLSPGKKALIRINETPAKKHRIFSLETHSVFTVFFNDKSCIDKRDLVVSHESAGFSKSSEKIDCGPAEITIRNNSGRTIGIIAASPETDKLIEAMRMEPPYFRKFVTGKMMLNNQSFRDLFLVDNLPNDLSLKVNDITLLFTDLKDSTAMYNITGDVKAYRLVKQHFLILQKMVQNNDGAIVKTMGDAIMASFNNPADAVKAAAQMLDDISQFNRDMEDQNMNIGLKIGIHRGAVIAVKANQTLDYFGQTVNIAARVQGLAGSGEIWITENIRDEENVTEILEKENYSMESEIKKLKGVNDPVKVYKCFRN